MRRLSLYQREGYLSRDAVAWLRGWLATAMMRGLPAPDLSLSVPMLTLRWGDFECGWWMSLSVRMLPFGIRRFPGTFLADEDADTVCVHSTDFTLSPVTAPLVARFVQGALS